MTILRTGSRIPSSRRPGPAGFTLIELMLVVVITLLAALVAVPILLTVLADA